MFSKIFLEILELKNILSKIKNAIEGNNNRIWQGKNQCAQRKFTGTYVDTYTGTYIGEKFFKCCRWVKKAQGKMGQH
jgi:hypothetical protein